MRRRSHMLPCHTKTIAKKNVSTTKKTGKRCSKASPHCGKEFVFDLLETRCVAEDDDTFCYCAGCVPATPAYFDESSDDEEEISPLYHERLSACKRNSSPSSSTTIARL